MTAAEKLYDLLSSQSVLLARPLKKTEWLVIADGYLKTLGKERKKAAVSDDAQEIYDLYPKKVAPLEAMVAITAALKKQPKEYLLGKTSLFADCVRSWPSSYRYFNDGGDRCPNPTTWFNQGRYADDPKEWRRAGARAGPDRPVQAPTRALTPEEQTALDAENEAHLQRLLAAPEPEDKNSLEYAFWLEARKSALVTKVVTAAEGTVKAVEQERRLRNA